MFLALLEDEEVMPSGDSLHPMTKANTKRAKVFCNTRFNEYHVTMAKYELSIMKLLIKGIFNQLQDKLLFSIKFTLLALIQCG